ncbi:hypothetical protein [Hyalangium gracile]|uniref:hypothetical protein n=1 Tax=Hyalangium gracile TaxID=394092 RepID=UPI001CC9CF38|nr:hypothetical protein [Hyalangium gracile]
MSSRDDRSLPPLPDEVRFAVAAFRTEQPSAHQQARIHAALQAAEARKSLSPSRPAKEPVRNWLSHLGLWMMMGAALAAVLLTVGVKRPGEGGMAQVVREALPLREVSIRVPEGGGWVALPWTVDRHPEGTARVVLETPAELDFHQHSSHLPTVQLVSCEGARCLHQFTTDAGAEAEPLRVRIHTPGHYVLNVSHASEGRHIHETFVVRAVP